MADKNTYELSRRKALAGLGTIGVAGAAAGMGTSALFSDEESFVNNRLEAGTLNLILEGGVAASNREGGADNDDITVVDTRVDGEEVKILFEIADVKPGDCYVIYTDEIIEGNPAYLEMSFSEVSDQENGFEEPEPVDDDPDGELDDLMTVTTWFGGSGPDVNDSLVGPGTETVITCDNVMDQPPLIDEQTLQNAFDHLAKAPDEGEDETDPANYEAVGPHQTNINDEFIPGQGSGPPYEPNDLPPGRYRKFWDLRLDESVGNEVQGDSVTFSINARVEQARNNDDPFSS